MHGSSEPDLRNWKSPTPQFTQGARPDEPCIQPIESSQLGRGCRSPPPISMPD
ncbi:hypothetical protein L552_2187 [Bordetella pertussis I002]|nr:hypothetical protein L552_2187 [Bordetella pertussis I002]